MQIGKITIAAVGKLKKDHWRTAQADYFKRLKRFTAPTVKEVRDSVGKGYPDAVAIEKEGQALLDATKDANMRVALTIDGQHVDSIEFAKILLQWIEMHNHLAFIIGGPAGLSSDVINNCQYKLSISRMTLPHELARIVLLEQLYRAETLINRIPYHK
jgi:23S rRNA (pseudouridine1915-N3)-methyltransferase